MSFVRCLLMAMRLYIYMLYNFNVLKILVPRLSDLMRNEKNLDKIKKLLKASDQRFKKN